MNAGTRTDTPDPEADALNRAIEARRHIRACPVCRAGRELCPTGRDLLAGLNAGLGALGDRMPTRGRVVRAFQA